MPELLALCRVDALQMDDGSIGVTAIDKRAVDEPLHVRPMGLYGDVQADRKHHGGLTKALYAYAEEDARFWEGELDREITPGLFGENLRTQGLDVNGAEIGERWRIGDTLVVEVTCPRTPCGTFQRRLREPRWVKRFADAARPGAYLKVVKSGTVQAGDTIEIVRQPGHGVTIASWFAAADEAQAVTLEQSERAGAVALAPEIHESIKQLRRQASR